MGCVYKLVALKQNNEYVPTIKLSEDTIKIEITNSTKDNYIELIKK